MLQAATPLIEVDFNNNLGVSSLVSRGSLNVTGTFQNNAAYSGTVPALNNGQGSSGVFGGVLDRVNFGNISGLNGLLSFTITGWVNFGANQVSYAPRLVNYRGATGGIDFLISSATTTPLLQLGVDGTLVTDTVPLTYNSWVFVAVTYDGTKSSNNVQFYVGDGNRLAATGVATANMGAVNIDAGENLLLGGMVTSPDGQRDYTGLLDGFQIYGSTIDASGALSAAQIDVARTTPDCKASSPLVEVDFNNGVGASSLVSRGSLSATGTFQGNATFSGTVPAVNNSLGSSGVFDGTGDRVNFGNLSGLNGLQSFTIAGWVNFGSGQVSGAPRLVSYKNNSAGIDFLISSATTSPKLQVGIDSTLVTDTTVLPYNSWVFVAVTYDGTKSSNNVQFYVGDSGTLTATNVATANMGAVDIDAGQILLLAGIVTSPDYQRDYKGLMDGFQIYGSTTDAKGVLTLAQLDDIRAAADCKAATPLVELDYNNNTGASSLVSRGTLSATGTFQGNAAFSGSIPAVNGGGYSGTFDGNGDRVTFGNLSGLNGLQSFTIAGWVNFGSGQANYAPRLLTYKNNNAGIDFLISSATTSPKLQLGVDGTLATDTVILSYNSWAFVAVTYDGTKTSNNVQFYVGNSGTLAATGTATLNMGAVNVDAAQTLIFGGMTPTDYSRDYKGFMDGFQIYGSTTDEQGVLSFAQLNDIRATADCAAGTWRNAYDLYNPTVQLSTIYNSTSHDSTIVYFDNTWIAQWDDGTEATGQKIRQSTSTDLVTWSAPIEVYSGTAGSTNPISDNIQWQPSLVVVTGTSSPTLWSVFMGQNNVWFSKLTSATGKWTNKALYGSNSQYPWPAFSSGTWSMFPGNNGLVLQNGRVMVPVTMQCSASGTDWMSERKQDAVIYTDDGGANWTYSPGVTFGDGTQCWESTIWQPDSTHINMIARNNRPGTGFFPDENLKYTVSTDGGVTWASEALLGSLEAALSRPNVVRKGVRNILAQNDWSAITDLCGNRRNLSLFFSRGNRNDDFVAGLNLTVSDGAISTTRTDYPQIATNGTTGAVIYSKFTTSAMSSSITKLATITPLPDDSKYYLFPRLGRNPVDAVSVDGRSAARFHDDFSSAGIDIDANTSSNSLYATFAVKPETAGQQCLFNLGNGVTLFSENGRLIMEKWAGGVVDVDCGPLPVGVWSTVDFISGGGTSWARSTGGIYNSVPVAPYPWTAYFGNHAYVGLTPYSGQTFLIDLASINVMVK